MRLTINLDDDLYAMARSHAIATRTSVSKAVGDLLRRKINSSTTSLAGDGEAPAYFDPVMGIQVSRSGRKISEAEVSKALADEDLAGLEKAGHAPRRKPD